MSNQVGDIEGGRLAQPSTVLITILVFQQFLFLSSVIVVTRGGYIKRMPLQTFENQRRGTRGKRGTSDSSSTDDEVTHCITCNDHDTLLMITQNGIAFGIPAYQVPSGSRTAKGTPLPSVLPISIDDVVTTVLPVSEFSKDEYIVLATKLGSIKKTSLDAFEKISARGLTIATLNEGDKLEWCHRCTDHDDILLGSSNGMAVRFPAASLRPTGRTSRGVVSMKLKEGDTIADMNVLAPAPVNGDAPHNAAEYVLCVTEQGYGKRVSTNDFRCTSRGKVGVIAMKFKKQQSTQDKMSCFCIVKEDDEILVNTSKGIMVRQKVKQIPCQSRSATGVAVQKVDESDAITSVSVVPITQDDEDESTESS
jgi:DNA gyrase subunit A